MLSHHSTPGPNQSIRYYTQLIELSGQQSSLSTCPLCSAGWTLYHLCNSKIHLWGCGWTVSLLACHAEDQGSFLPGEKSCATSGWTNIGREWCVEAGTSKLAHLMDSTPTRDRLPRKGKPRATHNVQECESVCAWNKNIVSVLKWLPCMNACMCALFHCICIYVCVHCIQTNVYVPLYNSKGINGVAFNKGPVPLERIAVAITSDYEIPAFLGIRR